MLFSFLAFSVIKTQTVSSPQLHPIKADLACLDSFFLLLFNIIYLPLIHT